MQVTCPRSVFDALPTPVTEGARVVVFAKFQYYVPRGSLSLQAREIRPVGVGELLARIEQRRQLLAAEGLFDPARKRRAARSCRGLIGLIVGRDSAAERDVVDNARRRWPGVAFRVEHAAVQGHDAARQVIEAIGVLDRDAVCRRDHRVAAAAARSRTCCRSPTRGCCGRSPRARRPSSARSGTRRTQPLLDLVADLRASTPTDAAKRVVPDVRRGVARRSPRSRPWRASCCGPDRARAARPRHRPGATCAGRAAPHVRPARATR